MELIGSVGLKLVSVLLLSGGFPLGVDAFAPPSVAVDSRSHGGSIRQYWRSDDLNILQATTGSSDDSFEVPSPRWNCPVHEDVCVETGVTLSRYMKEMVRANPDLEEIESSTLETDTQFDGFLLFYLSLGIQLLLTISPFSVLISVSLHFSSSGM